MSIPRTVNPSGHLRPVLEPDNATLQVFSGRRMEAAALDLEQLLGFRFGAVADTAPKPGEVCLALRPLTADSSTESWRVPGPVRHWQEGPLRIAESRCYTAAVVEMPEAGCANLKDLSQQAYEILLTAVSSGRHKRLLRIWNYFDEINEPQGKEERYRLFSSGRAMGFRKFGIEDQVTPVGTAIGTTGSGNLVLVALASEQPFVAIENPRQISAYHYPVDYGPDSPKFSRAGLLDQPEGHLFLVSGTAAVVGHNSAFHFDTPRQLIETLNNLDVLTRIGGRIEHAEGNYKPDPGAVIRVYLRNAQDLPGVIQALGDAWGELSQDIVFLEGDICRRELMIEMEAVLPVQLSDNVAPDRF